MYNVDELKKDKSQLIDLHHEMVANHLIIPSTRDNSLINPEILYLHEFEFNEMKRITEKTNNLIMKIVNLIKSNKISNFQLSFPNSQQILKSTYVDDNFLLARSDVFKREDGGYFVAEINYDKPSGHKETAFESYFNIKNNPNKLFNKKLLQGILKTYQKYFKVTNNDLRIALICDVYKYEEITLGNFYKEIFEKEGWTCDIIGINNVVIQDEQLYAFGKAYNVVFRKFPIEFNNEFAFFNDMIELYQSGKLLMFNDPNSIIAQHKEIFSLMWEYIDSSFFTKKEKIFIQKYIPFTQALGQFKSETNNAIQKLFEEREKWIIKEVFTRYSEGVYVGKEMHPNDWFKIVATALEMPNKFILQEFIPIKNEPTHFYYSNKNEIIPEHYYAYNQYKNSVSYIDEQSSLIKTYINYGLHLVNGKYAGMCVRLSPQVVTHEDTVFFQPVEIIKGD